MEKKWIIAFLVAIINDTLDYFVVGSIPVAGDVIDIVSTLILFPIIKTKSIPTLIELIPGADIIPTYIGVTLWAYIKDRN